MESSAPASRASRRSGPGRAGVWGVLLGAAVGLAAACAFPLDDEIACGDAYVDRAAGEECDPQDPARGYEQACVGTTRPRGLAA